MVCELQYALYSQYPLLSVGVLKTTAYASIDIINCSFDFWLSYSMLLW